MTETQAPKKNLAIIFKDFGLDLDKAIDYAKKNRIRVDGKVVATNFALLVNCGDPFQPTKRFDIPGLQIINSPICNNSSMELFFANHEVSVAIFFGFDPEIFPINGVEMFKDAFINTSKKSMPLSAKKIK